MPPGPSSADRDHAYPAHVRLHRSRAASGVAAAAVAARVIRDAIASRGTARIMVATGNSQLAMIDALMADESLAWDRVEAFHMDEYVGLPATHSASFRLWLNTRVAARRPLRAMHLIEGDAPSAAEEIARYTALLSAGPLDLAFVGFGENGHIAFNDPPVADFSDPAMLKVVTLDEACRRQQVGEGHFPHLDAVPRNAITVTCSGLFRAAAWICCVPEARKARAVRDALEGPISTACPASLVRRHPHATVFLDPDSASLLAQRPPLEA
jgi:glucosamine-6-phosphate deaminase